MEFKEAPSRERLKFESSFFLHILQLWNQQQQTLRKRLVLNLMRVHVPLFESIAAKPDITKSNGEKTLTYAKTFYRGN